MPFYHINHIFMWNNRISLRLTYIECGRLYQLLFFHIFFILWGFMLLWDVDGSTMPHFVFKFPYSRNAHNVICMHQTMFGLWHIRILCMGIFRCAIQTACKFSVFISLWIFASHTNEFALCKSENQHWVY